MTRGGREKDNGEPERRCIVTGDTQPKSGLLRFVIAPDGSVVPDLAGKLPGRGLWVTALREVLDQAVGKGHFARAAKQPVKVAEGFTDSVEAALALRVIELISLCRKAGGAVAGFERVKDWLETTRVRVLLQASDGSERGKGKLWTPEGARYFSVLTGDELGAAFGRGAVIHAVLAAGGLADRVVEEAAKLAGLRQVEGGGNARKDRKTA